MDATTTLFEGALFRARILRAWEIDGAYPAVSIVQEQSPVHQRARIAEFTVDTREYPQAQSLPIRLHSSQVLLTIVVAGEGRLQEVGRNQVLGQGDIVLIADSRQAALVWEPGARSLSLAFRRMYLQAAASKALGTPRRLAPANLVFAGAEDRFGIKQAINKLAELAGHDGPHYGAKRAVDALYDSLLQAILARHIPNEMLPVARSVRVAIDYIHANSGRKSEVEQLAAVAGVTQATLIKGFKACLGLSIKDYLTTHRLSVVRSFLLSGKESRSLADIAHAVGIAHASSLSRLYQQQFGETPSQTRAKAVHR